MSGSGRKTHYRKSVTEEFLNGLPVPEENEVICKTHGSRGTNIFEVELANGEMSLAMLPNKFKKLIWVKRGDYLIVSTTETTDAEGPVDKEKDKDGELKVQFLVKNILKKEQIAHIEKKGLWPPQFVLETKLARKEMTRDDLMPDYESCSEDEYEQEEPKVDKMGNTIIDDDENDDDDDEDTEM